ncbi:MAG: aminotransferase class IV, partial [Acidimicrobiia bacterium]|nr:aminotransferase class IV [Acidimicrobiia bacterium]
MILWLNGAMVSNSEARISPSDHGFLVGDGVFETLRVYSGVPFAWDRHRLRLEHSAAALGLTLPSDEVLRRAANDVIAMNALPDCRMRITITGGESSLGSDQSDSAPTAVIAVGHLTEWPVTASVVTVPWTRNERGATAGLKTTSYA